MKARLLAAALFLAGILCIVQQAHSQLTMTGVGGGFGAGAAYQGPGDIVSGATFWVGLRCYNAAYSGLVADIYDTATGLTETELTCSAGGTVNQTINPLSTTCAVACVLNVLYDQSGNTNCTSAACNFTLNASNFPVFTSTGCAGLSGGKYSWCAAPVQASTQALESTQKLNSTSQPYSASCVWVYRFSSAANVGCVAFVNSDINSDNTPDMRLQAGSQVNINVSPGSTVMVNNTWYATQAVYNGASSVGYVNGTQTTSLNVGANVAGTDRIQVMQDTGGNHLNGGWEEAGLWPVAFTTLQQSSLNANERSTANGWGF